MKKKLWCFILLAAILLSVPALAANTISMNFIENKSNQGFTGGEAIGPLNSDSSNWNSSIDADDLAAGTLTDLIDGTGTATTADVTWSSSNVWYNGDGTVTDEAKLAVGYLDDGGDGPSLTVTDIPYGAYNAYILITSDSNGDYTHGSMTVNGVGVLGGGFPAHGRVLDGTGWVECDGTVYGTYVKVSGLTGDLTVATVRDAGRAPITAFIIEEVTTLVVVDRSPADAATRVGQDVQLDWDVRNAQGTASFDVYLSDDPNDVDPNLAPVLVTTTTDTFYAPAAPLDPATLYYWRIDVADDVNTVPLTGDIYTFTTGGDVVDVYPADGATGVETDLTISWTGDAAGSTYIDEYAIYLGETLPGTPTATVTETQWTAPELADNTTYQCKVVSLHLGTPVDEATVSFTTGALVGYWPFDDDLVDAVGTNDATRDNPHFGTGVIGTGSAAEFSESYGDERVAIAIPDVASGGSWTISLWDFSDAEIGGGWESILGNGADADGWGVFEFGRYNFNRYIFGLTGTYRATPNDSSYLRGGWQCHVISYDSVAKVATWYINGEPAVADYTGKTITLDGELSVGNVKSAVQPFNGKVDDLKLYSRPLTDAQVLQNFIDDLAGKPYNPSPAVGTGNMPWDATLEWRFAETPDSAVIEVGTQPDLSDATPIALTGDMSSFETFVGLGVHLTPSTGYYWRVTPTYDGTPVEGPTWYFVVRDLLGDLSGNLKVNMEDVAGLSAQWQVDSFEIVPSGEEHAFVDQEAWNDVDPNLADYDAYVTPGGAWGTSELTVNTTPTPSDTNDFITPSQTLLWTATGEAGQQQLAGVVFPRGPINFNEFDSFGFWTYQTGCDGNFIFRPIRQSNAAQPINQTVWGMGSNDNKWHNYEWTIDQNQDVSDIYKVDIWVGDNEFTIEYGNFYLVKDGVEVPLCFEENWFAEDLNNDCIVDTLDLEIFADDWLLDASN